MEIIQTNDTLVELTGQYLGKKPNPDICPSCGASRSAILEMMLEPPDRVGARVIPTENNCQAAYMVINCEFCRAAVVPEYRRRGGHDKQ